MTLLLSLTSDSLVRRFLQAAAPLFPNNPRTVVGVSGGADSLALMILLISSGLVTTDHLLVAHFDHALRPDSAQDAQFTQESAHTLGLAWVGDTWSTHPKTGNLSALAREARYAFLQAATHEFKASHLAVGHHMDDQAETFLDRLLRGSGPQGLAAMPLSRRLTNKITLVRPLLFLRHQEITTWLATLQIPWLEDPSNQNPHYLRARIRHQLLPALQAALQQDPTEQLYGAAKRMARTNEALEWSLDRLWPELDVQISEEPKKISLSWQALSPLPEELVRRALLRCHKVLTKGAYPPGTRATTLFAHMMHSKRRHWSMSLVGLEIHRNENQLIFIASQQAPRGRQKKTT